MGEHEQLQMAVPVIRHLQVISVVQYISPEFPSQLGSFKYKAIPTAIEFGLHLQLSGCVCISVVKVDSAEMRIMRVSFSLFPGQVQLRKTL